MSDNVQESKTIPIGARVPADIAKSFKREAERRDISISALLIQTISKATQEAK